MTYEPALHKPVPLGSRVKIPEHYRGKVVTGEVIGISSIHVVFTYIVLLDEPFTDDYGTHRALCVGGAELDSEDGKTHWRLEHLTQPQ